MVYSAETEGGRVRPDGQVLKWLISAPKPAGKEDEVGVLPFFCGDVTPRSLRVSCAFLCGVGVEANVDFLVQVQTDPPSNTKHPSTALGLGHIKLLVSASLFDVTKKRLISVIGAPPSTDITSARAAWILDTALPPVSTGRPRLILGVPSDAEETAFLNSSDGKARIYEVAILVDNLNSGYPAENNTPYGRVIFTEV